MQQLTPNEIWESYLRKVRLEHTGRVLQEYLRVLGLFRSFLGSDRPTAEKAREHLQGFTERTRNTRARYTDIINGFLEWCDEDKVKRIKTPKRRPRYIPESDFDTFFAKLGDKKTHKKTIERDMLMFELMDAAGMRCGEIAALTVNALFLDGRDRNEPYLVAHGKGDKERSIPLTTQMADRLRSFVNGQQPSDFVFGLKAKTVTNKFSTWKKKAGVDMTAHDLRRRFATELNDLRVPTRTTQELLGHEDLATTQRYIAVPPKAAREAIELRQRHRDQMIASKGHTHDTDGGTHGDDQSQPKSPEVTDATHLVQASNTRNVNLQDPLRQGSLKLEPILKHVQNVNLRDLFRQGPLRFDPILKHVQNVNLEELLREKPLKIRHTRGNPPKLRRTGSDPTG